MNLKRRLFAIGISILVTPIFAQEGKVPFSKEIEFQSLVFQETGFIDLNKISATNHAALDKSVAEKQITKEEGEREKKQFRTSYEKVMNSIVLGPDAPLEEVFKNFKGDDPERRFFLVVKEGAFIGLLPKKPSRTNRTENKFYCKLPIASTPEYILEYTTEAGKGGNFSKVMSSPDKVDYTLVEVVAVNPEVARKLVIEQLKGPLVIARQAYYNEGELIVGAIPKKLSRAQYSRILGVASQIKSSDENFTKTVELFKQELDKITPSEIK